MTLRRWMLMVVIAVAIMIASVGMGAASAENFLGQGFDKCEIPTLSQMQNWITNSPYRAVNLYIGGSVRSCTNSALTASYVSQLSQQGWKFIPTWVGPQSAGWSGSSGSRISNDPATAYNEGINEANAAINVAINLGLALADGSGTIIYYDIENYDTTNTVYRNAAKSFISGWTAQLHARGSKAGVYGSSCGSGINDFASISNVPDAIWPANWFTPYQYRSDATVWDVACLSNGIWGNHQRIRQYAGGHSETWGGVTLNIDSNVIDGIVASSLPTISEKSLLRVDTQIEVYWLQNGKLYWITDWEIINQMSGIPGWAGDSVNILPVSVFNPATYPQGPRFITSTSEGMLIQENGAIDVYLISGGMRHYITYELFVSGGYDFADVIIVSPQIMNAITKGSDISTPPNTPITPAPSNGATNQPTTPTLSWTGGDPDGDSVIYTVYLSTSSNPTTQKCSGTSTSCSVSGLSYSTKYYWNVVASDGKSSPVTGPVWSFTTTTPSPIIGTWKVIGTIPLTGIKMPLHIAINQGKAYVGRNPAQLTVIDLATNTTNDILITPYSGATPGYIAFSGNKAYVTLSNLGSSGQVAVVNINDNTISAYIPVGVDPWGATTFNNKLYITNNVWWNDNSPATVKVINIDTNSILASIPVGINPTSIAVDPVTRKAYVTNHNDLSKSVSVIDTDTNSVVRTINIANPPAAVTISGNRAYIATTVNYPYGSVEVIDTNNYNMISSIPVDRDSTGIAALENYIFVANQASGTISIINVTSNTVVSTLAVGNNPTGVAVDPLTNKVYVTNQGDKNISIIGLVSNNPPNTPSNPSPVNGAINQPANPSLSWIGGDLDGDTVTYTVYLDPSSNPTTQKCSGASASCTVSGLSYSTTYYWKVVASDGKASPVSGPIWSFTTLTQPDFTISTMPPSQSISQGALITYSISIISKNGFNSVVSLSASGLPAGVTASFSPSSVTPTGSSTLNIQTLASTLPGNYPLTITGTGDGVAHPTTVTLSVTAACLTGDLDCNGVVDMNEMFIAIDAFAAGTVDMDYIFAAIDAFAATA